MNKSVFEFDHYKPYLKQHIQSLPKGGRGFRSEMAKALNCHSGYISQVLGGSAHLSLEQGQALTRCIGLNTDESHYFILMIQWERAGTKELKQYFAEQMNEAQTKRKDLQNRLQTKSTLSLDENLTYFSHWHYAATHAFVAIPGGKTQEKVAQFLTCSVERATKVLDFLSSVGLAQYKEGSYQAGSARIHLGSDSPLVSQHHTNWRMQAIYALAQVKPDDLHYSSVISASHQDLPRIREILIKAIEEVRAVVKDSPEEGVFCYLLDLFPVGKP